MDILPKFIKILLLAFLFFSTNVKADKVKDYKKISFILQEAIQFALNEDFTAAHQSFEKAYTIAKDKDYKEILAVIDIAQSRLYATHNDYEKGLNILMREKEFFEKDSMSSLAGDYHEYIAQCLMHQNKLQEALLSLQHSEKIRLLVEPAKNWRTYNGMTRIYHRLGQHDTAEEYSKKAEKLAKIQNSKRVLMDLQNELTFDEKDGTISILNSENKKTKVDLQKSKFKNFLFGTGLLVFSLISGFLFIILRQRSKLNKEIVQRNELISKNLEEKEYLIKEIHHRVKNNLQVISSLLSLQSRSIEDQNAIIALNESQNRVVSMSLIHQNLYKDGNASQLDLKSYLHNLTQNLFHSYNINGTKIKLILDVGELNVDVSSLVPLGLIVNELITNSLKYAFKDRDQGTIGVMCKDNGEDLVLKVWDDGSGTIPETNSEGFGKKLIVTFAKRLNASLTTTYESGTHVELIIQNYKKAI